MAQRSKQNLGGIGEKLAVNLLQKKGYRILEKNFRSKLGEIDIIALDPSTSSGQVGATLVFIEVKTRWSKNFGPPEEAVTPRKIRSIIKTGQYYRLLHPQLPEALRIDVVAVDLTESTGRVRLIKNVTG
jgi:putative endonuclease